MTAALLARVERGEALLDQRNPGWWRRLDVERLNVSSVRDCVLGQLYGYYVTGLIELDLLDGPAHRALGATYGFSGGPFTDGSIEWVEWETLTQIWKLLVRGRQSSAGLALTPEPRSLSRDRGREVARNMLDTAA